LDTEPDESRKQPAFRFRNKYCNNIQVLNVRLSTHDSRAAHEQWWTLTSSTLLRKSLKSLLSLYSGLQSVYLYLLVPYPRSSASSSMSFVWSIKDFASQIRLLRNIWSTVSDSRLNTTYEAPQFFDELNLLIELLVGWEERTELSREDFVLLKSYQQLRQQATHFIQRHTSLIEEAGLQDVAHRKGQSLWSRKAQTTQGQVAVNFYQRLHWPSEVAEVKEIREKLQLFIAILSSSTPNVFVDPDWTANEIKYIP